MQSTDLALPVLYLLTDSRKLTPSEGTLFFAIEGERHDGHNYLEALIKDGIRQFVVEKDVTIKTSEPINLIKVNSAQLALQQVAAYKRNLYQPTVVGITGSNGKTIVKEWLAQLLAPYKTIIKSPGSYNSQIGVPLSVWQLEKQHQVAIFEAGISKPGEMLPLEEIIKPTIGIFTNIGPAHDEGFSSRKQKVKEKALLFAHAQKVIYCKDYKEIDKELNQKGFTWGKDKDSDIVISEINKQDSTCEIGLVYENNWYTFLLPFNTDAAIENAMHCIAFMLDQRYSTIEIQSGLDHLRAVKMRLELKRGINGCQLIDDTYNSDLGGLQVAIDFLVSQKQHHKKTAIISDMLQTGLQGEQLYDAIGRLIKAAKIDRLIAIGPDCSRYLNDVAEVTYASTKEFLKHHDLSSFEKELILIKGARKFAFEQIVKQLEEKIHGTQLEINLDALTHNLNYFRSKLDPSTKLMVMVKAFAYGSGSLEIANLLQHHRVDYLGVAYADEGVALRRNGINLPIMVMNPSEDSFEKLREYQLEPEIYNPGIFKKFLLFLEKDEKAAIHLKLETGMHRLGFTASDIDHLIEVLNANKNIRIKSLFSHLAGADEGVHDDFSNDQARQFDAMSERILSALSYKPLRHLVNSSGIMRFPKYHYDMVRLGIGLYGVGARDKDQERLAAISSLKTIVSQINHLKDGDTVGYGRKGKVDRDTRIATIAIGYADGFSRAFSNGAGKVYIHDKLAPVIGNVCMDMTMVDVSHIDEVKEGDEVEIFGSNLTIAEVAGFINTIPYEILTNVSQRVKRVYHTE